MCLDAEDNELFQGALYLRQQAGSDFALAGLQGSGSNPYAVESFLGNRNQYSRVEVERYGGASVSYAPTAGCALP